MKSISKSMDTLMKYQYLRAAATRISMSSTEEVTFDDDGHDNHDDDSHLITSSKEVKSDGSDDLVPINLEDSDDDYAKLVDLFNECGQFSALLSEPSTTTSNPTSSNNDKNQGSPKKRKRTTTNQECPLQYEECRRDVVGKRQAREESNVRRE